MSPWGSWARGSLARGSLARGSLARGSLARGGRALPRAPGHRGGGQAGTWGHPMRSNPKSPCIASNARPSRGGPKGACAVARLSNRAITNLCFSPRQLSGNSSYPPSSELGQRPPKHGHRINSSPVTIAYKPHISYNNSEAL